ncbi:hypothetical protein BDN70DRAFT_132797 [Pholiota conissans]|uniref:Uncharacterized protein n=1 Tax=Pholiota conissans TaxID=109636 RepID=A0A9P5YX10_9AGAR|nr:hypothetical protein BDN70DRAFT_132797 [Pholiota conissans]
MEETENLVPNEAFLITVAVADTYLGISTEFNLKVQRPSMTCFVVRFNGLVLITCGPTICRLYRWHVN